ncbi:MAG: glycosyltransferase family 2 protein [Acidimicrobiales bacterium]|jgi:GT2 family glycosyltransferase
MPEQQAPPVVAVVVASDPGPWFEECLEALGRQDYPNLDVLVVDAASHAELTARVALVLPRAFILRQRERKGFSAAANEALEAIEGASHLLICHDDVALAPDAVRCLVGEAYRSNAGIVGPKLVEWDAPDHLLEVGIGVDRFGVAVERVERGELDQAQHDEGREVFAVPGGCMLVRADLFRALGGFDPDIELFGEDVDLCWRAQVAGARVVVAPSARVRHVQVARSGSRTVGDLAMLRRRHELRAVLKNYDQPRRLFVVLDLAAGSIAEVSVALFRGERERAKRVADAWWWNWRHRRSLRLARKALASVRQRPDRVVARLLSRGDRRSALEANPIVPIVPVGPVGSVARAVERRFRRDEDLEPARIASSRNRLVVPGNLGWVVLALIVVVVFGIRNLLTGHLPLVGQLLPFPSAPSLLRDFFGGWQDAGWQATGPAPPGFGLMGLVGAVLLGSTAQVEKLLLLGPILVGAIGMHRLLRPLGSSRARLAATIAYLGLPLVWNGIAAGDLQALVTFGGMPFVMSRICRATRLEPFAAPEGAGGWRAVVAEAVPFGLLLAFMAALAPPSVVAVVVLSVTIVLGAGAAGRIASVGRAFGVTAAALGVAFACCFPWSLTFVQPGARWSVLSGAVPTRSSVGGVLRLFRLDAGPIGAGWLGWGILLGAGFVLFVARGARLEWAARWWVAAVGTVVVAYAGAVGWLGAGGGATLVLLAPAACCIAAAVGLGVAAFEVDLARSRFGWRQNLSAAAVLCLVIGLFPTLVSSVDGRSSLPSFGYEQLLGWTTPKPAAKGYDVLWVGDPASVPPPAWQIRPGLAFAMSVDGLPNGERLWPSANPGVGTLVETDLTSAEAGLTVRLGAELARVGIRYLILPGAVAPDLPGVQVSLSAPPPPNLVKTLQVQSDFRELPTEGGVLAFEDTAWSAADSPAPGAVVTRAMAGHTTPALIRELGLAAGLLAVSLAVAEGVARRRKRRPLSPESEAPPGDAAILDLGPSDGGAPSPAGSSAEDPADRPEPAPSTLS